MYICIYPSASHIHTISISIPISTYLPTKPSSIDHCFLFFPSPPRPARVRVCMCIYELIEGFSSLSCSAPKKKKRNIKSFASLRRLPSLPPSPCDGSSHIQSQLDKARQDKARQATCLPAKRIKKKIRNPPSDNVTMLSNLPAMDYYRGGWPVCLSRYLSVCLSVYLVWSGLPVLSTIRSSHVHAHAMILRGTIPFLLYLTVPRVYTKSLPGLVCIPGLVCLV